MVLTAQVMPISVALRALCIAALALPLVLHSEQPLVAQECLVHSLKSESFAADTPLCVGPPGLDLELYFSLCCVGWPI